MCQIYSQLLSLFMPFLLDLYYPKSVVVRKTLNSLMGLYYKEKKSNITEESYTSYPTHLWLQVTPGDLTYWVKYHVCLKARCPRMT